MTEERQPLLYLDGRPVFVGDIIVHRVTGLRVIVRSAEPDCVSSDSTKLGPWTFFGEVDQGQGHLSGMKGYVFGPYAKLVDEDDTAPEKRTSRC